MVALVDGGGLEPAGTVAGMVQRGRGRGAAEILSVPDPAGLVLDCAVHDRRWDQVDERSLYLARLIRFLGAPLTPIAQWVLDPANGAGAELAVDVLILLARGGSMAAVAIMRDYLAQADGPLWRSAIDEAWDSGVPELRGGLDALVLPRLGEGELEAVAWEAAGPWQAWRHAHPPIDAILRARAATRPARAARPVLDGRSAAELHGMTISEPDLRLRRAAWGELGRRGDLSLLDLAESPQARNRLGGVPGLAGALAALGPAALDRARAWLRGPDPVLAGHAVTVLAAHGTAADGPGLLRACEAACAQGDWCLAENAAPGLARLAVPGAVSLMHDAWQETPHSYARGAFLPAIHALGAAAGGHLAEGLHDCESAVRAYACLHCPLTSSNSQQLAVLTRDPLEDSDVRSAARHRLAGEGPP